MAFLGVVLLLWAGASTVYLVVSGVRASRVRRHGVPVTADIIGIDTYRGQAGVSRSRVVRFTVPDGRTVTVKLPSGQLRGLPVGDRAEVRYLPERPEIARASEGGGGGYVSLLLGIVVLTALGVDILMKY